MRVRGSWALPALVLLVVGCTISGVRSLDDSARSRIDVLLESGKTVDLALELRSYRLDDARIRAWLTRRAHEGHAVALYELARRTPERDREDKLRWFTRARLVRILDEAECVKGDYPSRVGLALDLDARPLEKFADQHELTYAEAARAALAWEQTLANRPSPIWICGPSNPRSDAGNVLPRPQRESARARQRAFLVARADALVRAATAARLPANPDGFDIKSLADAYPEPIPLFWIDESRVLFRAIAPGSPLTHGDRTYARYVWNVSTGRVTATYGPTERPSWCFSGGYSTYVVQVGTEFVMYAGQLGSEVEILRYATVTPNEERPHSNEFDCRPPQPGKPDFDPRKGRRLAGNDGYIGRVPQSGPSSSQQLAFYKGDSPDPQPLPVRGNEYQKLTYSRYLGAYLLQTDSRSPAGQREIHAWLLFPDGRLERTTVPDGPWTSASLGFSYGTAGLLMFSHALSSGNAGLYLIRGGNIKRIVAGYLEAAGMEVADNGCRVALTLSHLPRESQYLHRLYVVDLCTRVR